MSAFWERGYAGTSLTDLSEATGMNRPSLYAAFGDKHAIYRKALGRYAARMATYAAEALAADGLEDALMGFYSRMIELFVTDAPAQRGCMVAGSASVDAVHDPTIRQVVLGSIERLDAALIERFRRAAADGELPRRGASQRGRLATAILHSLSLRARAGQSRRALRKFARESVALLVERDAG